MASPDGPHGLLTLVCITCGNEKHFATRPPAGVVCEKCQGTVFRNYFTPVDADEATVSQLEETARSLAYDDDASAVSNDELRDLDESTDPEPERPRP
jgi:hypothetical protein